MYYLHMILSYTSLCSTLQFLIVGSFPLVPLTQLTPDTRLKRYPVQSAGQDHWVQSACYAAVVCAASSACTKCNLC